jgi:excisionase family DNA binding protein
MEKLEAVMTIEEIAEQLRVTTRTVKTYIYAGLFPGAFQLPGRHWRVPASVFQSFIENRRTSRPQRTSKRKATKKRQRDQKT